jgi:hypothetical protein
MHFPHKVDDKRWMTTARTMLRSLQRQSSYARYTLADATTTAQSPLVSALNAMTYRWFDGDMAADEIRSASGKQITDGDDAGLIPAYNHYGTEDAPLPIAAPPLLAVAAVAVYHLTGDSNLIEKLYPRLTAYHDWLDRTRVQDDLAIPAHPAETLRGTLNGATSRTEYRPTQHDIFELNVLRAADLDGVAHLAMDMGMRSDAAAWEARAQIARAALQTATPDPLNPLQLFAESVTPEVAGAIAVQLEANDALWLPDANSRAVSVVYNWLIYVGLRRYEQRPAANRLAERTLGWAESAGDFAWYDADTGWGVGPAGQSVSMLAVEMLFRERQSIAPGSHCI